MRRWCRVAAILVLCAACQQQRDEPGERLVMSDRRFEPGTLIEGVAEQVTLRVINDDDVIHNLTIPAIPADVDFEPGQRQTVIFVTPPTSGAIEFYCKFHRDQGMRGTVDARRPGDTRTRSTGV